MRNFNYLHRLAPCPARYHSRFTKASSNAFLVSGSKEKLMYRRTIILLLSIIAFALPVAAQEAVKSDDTARLKQQLIELENKETQLRLRLEQLDEALKPENIEFALAGIGSTRPEELREHRRKMLTIERDSVETQLKLIEESRTRTEAAIAAAESSAYLKYLQPSPTPSTQMAMSSNAEIARSILRTILLSLSALIFVFAGLVSIVGWRRML